MIHKEITVVIDYGASNTLSVLRALDYLGHPYTLTNEKKVINIAKNLLLPGVGAFPDAMEKLKKTGLDNAIKKHVKNKKPIFGICLGMQLLFTRSFEFQCVSGLNLLKGDVLKIPNNINHKKKIRVPNIGWRNLKIPNNIDKWEGTPLQKIKQGQSLYFAHSYRVVPEDNKQVIAYCDYEGLNIPAVIRFQNIFGCQFHPEKSGPVGLDILNEFLSDK